jgi:crotonobetainyl-CoA:carnitine CoA-transferase CaiB-like acyl-CoA transferase
MIALRVVEHGGKGQVIDLPLLDPIISILGPDAAIHRVSGDGGAGVPCYRTAGNDRRYDPRFRTNTDRVRHIDECNAAVAEFIAQRTLDEGMTVSEAAE